VPAAARDPKVVIDGDPEITVHTQSRHVEIIFLVESNLSFVTFNLEKKLVIAEGRKEVS